MFEFNIVLVAIARVVLEQLATFELGVGRELAVDEEVLLCAALHLDQPLQSRGHVELLKRGYCKSLVGIEHSRSMLPVCASKWVPMSAFFPGIFCLPAQSLPQRCKDTSVCLKLINSQAGYMNA